MFDIICTFTVVLHILFDTRQIQNQSKKLWEKYDHKNVQMPLKIEFGKICFCENCSKIGTFSLRPEIHDVSWGGNLRSFMRLLSSLPPSYQLNNFVINFSYKNLLLSFVKVEILKPNE